MPTVTTSPKAVQLMLRLSARRRAGLLAARSTAKGVVRVWHNAVSDTRIGIPSRRDHYATTTTTSLDPPHYHYHYHWYSTGTGTGVFRCPDSVRETR